MQTPELKLALSYFIRDASDVDGLEEVKGHPIQLGLNTLDARVLAATRERVEQLDIEVPSIHLRRIKPEESFSLLTKLHEEFGAQTYTVHPDKRTVIDAKLSWIRPLKELEKEGIKIGFENMRSKSTWLHDPFQLPKQKEFYLTLDLGHLDAEVNQLQTLMELASRTLIVHVTDSGANSFYDHFDRLIPVMFTKTQPLYVLEYGRDQINKMRQDYKVIKSLYEEHSRAEAC